MRVVLARAMDEDPARRYPTGLAFASALEAAARGGRVTEAVTAVGAITDAAITPAPVSQPEDPEPDLALAAAAALGATSVADDRGVNVEFDPEPDIAEADYADVAAERDEDAAHYEIEHAGRDQQERMVFDEEAAADLGFDRSEREIVAAGAPARLWEQDPEPLAHSSRPPSDRNTGAFGFAAEPQTDAYAAHDSVSVDADRPRTAVLPIAVTLILGLLVGFAAGYWAGGRTIVTAGKSEPPPAPSSATASAPPPAQPAKSPATGDAAKPAGKTYTEGTVAQPTATPPIPDEGPRSAPREARTPPPAAAATTGRLRDHLDAVACVRDGERPLARPHPAHAERDEVRRLLVRVIAPGFTTGREDVALSASDPVRNLAVRLQRSTPAQSTPPARSTTAGSATPAATGRSGASGALTGSIYMDSRPSSARILVDGHFAGTTPARIPEVSIGSHVVRLELSEHRPWTAVTRVTAGEETRVTGSLERIQ